MDLRELSHDIKSHMALSRIGVKMLKNKLKGKDIPSDVDFESLLYKQENLEKEIKQFLQLLMSNIKGLN